MRFRPSGLVFLLFAALLGTAVAARAQDQEYASTRNGVIDSIHTKEGVTTLRVSITKEQAKPEAVTSFTNGSTHVVPGMPVYLVIIRSGASFTPAIGQVASVEDAAHCTVRVDAKALDQTWQDPSDDNKVHKVAEYLTEGATVALGGVTRQ